MAAGNLDFGLTTEDILTAGDGVETTVIQATDLTGMGGGVVVPGGTMLLTAEFTQEGSDLVLTGADGSIVVIQDYFSVAESPALETSGGAQLPADLVMNLAHAGSPMQVAQDGGGALDEPIGTVDTAVGGVAIRADGTRVELEPGSPVYQGDVLQTETGDAIEITFIDDTAFTIGEEGRMVLDELVFDPETNEGSSSFSVVQGVFSFVSGAIAKTGSDAMTVRTPVATIGIRGTQVAVQAAAEGEENVITLLQEEGGITGEIVVSNSAGTQVLNEAFATTTIQSFFTAPSEPVILPEAQVNQMFGGAVAALQANIAGREAREEARAEEARAEEAAAAVTDLDGSESITDITISGVPEGAVLSAGTDNGNGSWTLSEDQLAGLAITPPADDDNDFRLNVEVTATEFASGNTSTTASEHNVSVAGLADGPRVTATDVAGDEDIAIALDVGAALADTDGSESITDVTISGVPRGAVLSAGTDNGDGTWTLTPAELTGLTLTPPLNSDDDFALTISATSTEGEGGSATSLATFNVDVTGVADVPVVNFADASGGEDLGIPLDVSAALVDLDGSETITAITVDGVPAGAQLSAGSDNGDGTWSLDLADLTGLSITAPADSSDDLS